MVIERERCGTTDLIRLSGRLDAVTSSRFEAEIEARVEDESNGIVVDFSNVEYISSAGLRALLLGVRACARKARPFVLAAATADVRDVIVLTGFDKVLTLDVSVESALRRVSP
ncbi:MAG: STAS domain-containing protein [Pseudomonadota bacterium]